MSNLIVLAFDNPEEAGQVLQSLRQQSKQGTISLNDTAVVVKDADGKVHVDNQVSKGTWAGTGLGALVGILLGGCSSRLAACCWARGAAPSLRASWIWAWTVSLCKTWQTTCSRARLPSSFSARAIPMSALGVLREHNGKVLQTTLSSEAEANLKEALGDTGESGI